jgi:outer membrane protein
MKFVRLSFRPLRSLAVIAFAITSLRAQPAPQQPVPDQLDLKTAIAFAIDNNFAIRQARERIRQQEGVVTEVTARSIPNVAATGDYQRNTREISQSFPQSDRFWSFELSASQTLYAGGGVRSSIRSSKLTREAAMLDLQSVINDSLLSVRVSFYGVLLSREKIKVQEENLRLLQEQAKTTNDRYEAGTVSSFEKLRAEVAVANAQVPLITARNDYRLAIEALRQALGFTTNKADSIRKIPEFVGTLSYEPTSFDLEASFAAAHDHRPDLQRLAKLSNAREESVTTARAGHYPNVSLVGGYELAKGITNGFGDSVDGVFVGLQSQWAIFDGRATNGRIVQAKSVLEQAKLQLAEAQLAAEVEVRQAHSTLQEANEVVDVSQKVVGQAEEAARLSTARYDAGTATQLDVLQSQVDLTTARLNQVQAFYSYNVAVATIRRATGVADVYYAPSP